MINKIKKLIHFPQSVSKRILNVEKKNINLEKAVAKLKHDSAIKTLQIKKLNKIVEDLYVESINNRLLINKSENLVITTYPSLASRNVGDAMITKSFLDLKGHLTERFDYVTAYREIALERLDLRYIKNIYLPGMSVSPSVYPKLYKLFNNIERIRDFNIYPIACSFQHVGDGEDAYDVSYSSEDKKFFSIINKSTGPINCRDKKIVELLKKNDIDANYFGDLVFYDHNNIGKEMCINQNIKSIAFSVQHNPRYHQQAFFMLCKIREYFPNDTSIYVTLHSEENMATNKFISMISGLKNIHVVNLSGDPSNLDFYDDIDLHMGYRLHGHISFLRRRKPSILVSEDVRSYGFYCSGSLGIGIFKGYDSSDVSLEVIQYLDDCIKNNFENYHSLFNEIDSIYEDVVVKFLL